MPEERTTSSTGGQKGVKLERWDLIPVRSLQMLAEHYGRGAQKYAEHQWRQGYEWSKSYSAAMRHFAAFWAGYDFDVCSNERDNCAIKTGDGQVVPISYGDQTHDLRDGDGNLIGVVIDGLTYRPGVGTVSGDTCYNHTGSHHLVCAMWHCSVLLEFVEHHPDHDDRYIPGRDKANEVAELVESITTNNTASAEEIYQETLNALRSDQVRPPKEPALRKPGPYPWAHNHEKPTHVQIEAPDGLLTEIACFKESGERVGIVVPEIEGVLMVPVQDFTFHMYAKSKSATGLDYVVKHYMIDPDGKVAEPEAGGDSEEEPAEQAGMLDLNKITMPEPSEGPSRFSQFRQFGTSHSWGHVCRTAGRTVWLSNDRSKCDMCFAKKPTKDDNVQS